MKWKAGDSLKAFKEEADNDPQIKAMCKEMDKIDRDLAKILGTPAEEVADIPFESDWAREMYGKLKRVKRKKK